MRILKLVLILVVLANAQYSHGSTLRVEKDGTGDYTVIQDAVDAAADGDVIKIGAGRFDDYTTDGGWDLFVRIPEISLTIIGTGSGGTIIGPSDPAAHSNNTAGIVSVLSPGFLRVENLTIENINRVAIESSCAVFELENCTINECAKVLQAYGGGGFVRNCSFSGDMAGVYVFSLPSEFIVEDCIFDDVNHGVLMEGSGALLVVRNCSFVTEESEYPSQVGIQVSGGGLFEVSNCQVEGYHSAGIAIGNYSEGSIRDCTVIQRDAVGLLLGNHTNVQFTNSILFSDEACIWLMGTSLDGLTYFHNNHILREGSGLYVKNGTGGSWPFPTEYFDMTNNYWGTQDPDEISQYIEDGHSMPSVDYFINFLPLADGPVATERKSLDSIKALYR